MIRDASDRFRADDSPDILSKRSLSSKPRMLCIHGRGSNSSITERQLQLLCLKKHFNVTHVQGPYKLETAYESSVGSVSSGQYYSWFEPQREPRSNQAYVPLEQLTESLKRLLKIIKARGPFDAVYGFSQGATLAAVLSHQGLYGRLCRKYAIKDAPNKPWKFAILCCSSYPAIFYDVSNILNLSTTLPPVSLLSTHIIGIRDRYKPQSDTVLANFDDKRALPIYMNCEHEVVPLHPKRALEIIEWSSLGIQDEKSQWSERLRLPVILSPGNDGTPLIPLHKQICMTTGPCPSVPDKAEIEVFHSTQCIISQFVPSNSTLFEVIGNNRRENRALFAPNLEKAINYGDLADFIMGEGNLLRLGVTSGEVVAFVAPGGISSALAFLTIASQVTCAPLDPTMNASEVGLAIEQMELARIIFFHGNIEINVSPFVTAATNAGIPVHHAKMVSTTEAFFKFEDSSVLDDDSRHLLLGPDEVAMLLRTSGTTSKPRVVPLKMQSLISNAGALALNLDLSADDIALNAMPLFHIGGLQANLLASIVSGAAVILLEEFDVHTFLHHVTAASEMQPTWYSAVPTMHFAITQQAHVLKMSDKLSHKLRFIRSGAAAMLPEHTARMHEVFECPVILTYSMSEQMPITQPPTMLGRALVENTLTVGRPIATSLCIVDSDLVPLPYGTENIGEICISGPNIMSGYLNDAEANASAFFRLGNRTWFRTGDMGAINTSGFLFLKGRLKELIKTGGEQVSPHEVEEVAIRHPHIANVVVFPITDPILGQKVGMAIVMEQKRDEEEGATNQDVTLTEMRAFLLSEGLKEFKLPHQVIVLQEKDLPKTKSNKYKRLGISEDLGLTTRPRVAIHESVQAAGFTFALGVMFTHIGDIGNWTNARTLCFHSPCFFFLGGFLMSSGTHHPVVEQKLRFYAYRFASLHPMYMVSLLALLVNLIIRCNPSNYSPSFNWTPSEGGANTVCQATPFEMSWGTTLAATSLNYVIGFQAWLFTLPFSWFLSSYSWFTSVYYFCIWTFPYVHDAFFRRRLSLRGIWNLMFFWLIALYAYLLVLAMYWPLELQDARTANLFALCGYLFPVGWLPCFALGVGAYFLLTRYRPADSEKASCRWGYTTDAISFLMLGAFLWFGFHEDTTMPDNVDTNLDERHWAYFRSRAIAPIGFIWVVGLSVGRGWTAQLLSSKLINLYVTPGAYNMYLWHQAVSEWYFLATRGTWWNASKTFYWFSPLPIPVSTFEVFLVVFIVIVFSNILERCINEPLVNAAFRLAERFLVNQSPPTCIGGTTVQVVGKLVEKVTGIEMQTGNELSTLGLNSMTSVLLVYEIQQYYSKEVLTLRSSDLASYSSVDDLAAFIDQQVQSKGEREENRV